MNSFPEQAAYQHSLAQYPPQHAAGWRWMDTRAGAQTLILLPGFLGEAETSFHYIQALAPHLRVISVSYPAHIGQVAALGHSFSAFLDELGISRAAIVGGSSSGFLAQAFLRQIPTRLSACILTHTGLPRPSRARTARFYRTLIQILPFGLLRALALLSVPGFYPGSGPAHTFWRDHFRSVLRRQTRPSLANRFALMEDFHHNAHFHPGDLSTWPGRLLILEMQRDPLTTPAEQAALRATYPQAQVHTFPETAHYDSVHNPQAQIDVMKAFLLNPP